MKTIFTDETVDILGRQKNTNFASEETSHFETSNKEAKFGKFKSEEEYYDEPRKA